jgi:peptide deformylase
MEKNDIIVHPDSRLKLVSARVEEIDSSIRQLVEQMFENMYDAQGFGLAAIQIAVPKRVVVMDLSRREGERNPLVFINPEITGFSEEVGPYNEGCLSVPELYVDVERPVRIGIRYQDLEGKFHEEEADGLLARCMQHEVDHLDGLLFIDRLSRLKRQMALKKYEKLRKIARDQD